MKTIKNMTSVLAMGALIGFASFLAPVATAVGTQYVASGTYTYNAATGALVLTWTASDFACEGPDLGSKTLTVTVTDTILAVVEKSDVWTRSTGVAGSIVGTWTETSSSTGNSSAFAFGNDGSVTLTADIVSCGSDTVARGSVSIETGLDQNTSAKRYRAYAQYYDPNKAATSVRISGVGVTTASQDLSNKGNGNWSSDNNKVDFAGNPPAVPLTYTFTVTTSSGTTSTTASSGCVMESFATNLLVVNGPSGVPVFTWTKVAFPNISYHVNLYSGSTGSGVTWTGKVNDAASVTYGGAPLSSGVTYKYNVSANDPGKGCYSAIEGRFVAGTLPNTTVPGAPVGLAGTATSSSQVTLSWTGVTVSAGTTTYKVYRNNALIGNTSATSYSDTALNASTTYSYSIVACDVASNCSTQSSATTLITPAGSNALMNSEADCLFNWGEDGYSTLLSPARPASATTAPYYYRYYTGTRSYLGISSTDNHLYFLNAAGLMADLGLAATWSSQAKCR